MFTMLVIMATASTFLATPLIRYLTADEQASEPDASLSLTRAEKPSPV